MAKGKKRADALKAKKADKRQLVKAGAPSKYAAKMELRIQGVVPETSPFHFDPSNPQHKTMEQARQEESDRFRSNRSIPRSPDSSF